MTEINTRARTAAESYDEGLRTHFRGVYNVMSLGLVVTGLVAYLVANTPALTSILFGNPIMAIIVAFAPLAFIFFGFTPNAVRRKSSGQLKTVFF